MILPGDGRTEFFGNPDDDNFFQGKYNADTQPFDPYITGHGFIIWGRIPEWVVAQYPYMKSLMQKNFGSFQGLGDLELNVATATHGFSVNERGVPTAMGAKPSTFSIDYELMSGLPLNKGYQYWTNGIRDMDTGVATYAREAGLDYRQKFHTGELMYFTTRPDSDNVERNIIEQAVYVKEVFPTVFPLDYANYTKGTHDTPTKTQTFRGIMFVGAEIDAAAKNLLVAGNTGYTFSHAPENAAPNLQI